MPVAVLDLLTIVAVVVVLRARLSVVLALLVTTVVVVPAPLLVPHTHVPYATFLHIVTAAALVRLVAMRADRSLVRGVLRGTPALVALGVLVLVTFTFGVVFVLHANAPTGAEERLVGLGEQVAFLVVCLALIRQIDDVDVALRAFAVAAVLSGGIGVVEHITSNSWGHWLFSQTGQQTNAATELLARGDARRVKGGAEFALQYGWLMVMLLPVVVVAAVRNRWSRVTVPASVALISLSVYWCYSRSALAGLLVVLVVLGALARERRVTYAVGGTLLAFFAVYLVHPVVATHFSEKFAQGSVTTRFERFMPLLQNAAAHPFRGLGLGGLVSTGFQTTDNAFLLQYIELGALGVVMLVVVLLVALGQAGRGVLIRDESHRMVAAAVVAGVAAYVISCVFYDAFTLQQGACLLWVLVALGAVVAEQRDAVPRLPRPAPRLVAGTAVVGLLAGVGVYFAAPTHAGQDLLFTTLPGYSDAFPYDVSPLGNTAIGTACPLAELYDDAHPAVSLSCSPLSQGIGFGQLHIEASSSTDVAHAVTSLQAFEQAHGDPWFATDAFGPPQSGRRSVWTTAPLWLPVGLLLLLLLLPWRFPRDPSTTFVPDLRARRFPRRRRSAYALR